MKRVVSFSDAHVSPGQNLERFDWLGRLIVDVKPDAVWNGGDLATCDSVSFWAVPYAEQCTLKEELDVLSEAQHRLFEPTREYNRRRRENKHSLLRYDTLLTMGNHEYRLHRKLQQDERGLGSVVDPLDLFQFRDNWKQIVDYKEYLEYEGCLFTHCPINGLGKPISGAYRGRHIAMQSDKPTIYGHTHKMDYTELPVMGATNKTRTALNMPCFLEQDHVEGYARGSCTGWSYGVVILDIFQPGRFTFNWLSMAELKHKYGDSK